MLGLEVNSLSQRLSSGVFIWADEGLSGHFRGWNKNLSSDCQWRIRQMWATLSLFWAVKDRGWSAVCVEYNYQGARQIFECNKENDQVIVRFLDWNVHYHAEPWSELAHLQEEVWRELTWWRNENSKVGLKSLENSAPKSDLLQVCTYFWNKEKNFIQKIFPKVRRYYLLCFHWQVIDYEKSIEKDL